MHVVATAGHVDHGKSTLVRALTGTDPDRWAEEHRRGLTIDLGYAWTDLPSGQRLAFVDVPGHARFLANMLAGLGPAPAVLLVVAADEGWRAQTSEHLAAVTALGLRHVLVAVTRCDLTDPSPAARAARERLGAAGIEPSDVVAVSGTTGAGLDRLRAALDHLVARLPRPDTAAPVRLWVDRAFTVRGAGTVVTGTLAAGALRTGDELVLRGRPVRVRSLQALGEPRDEVAAVARVAVGLRGTGRDEVARGDALLTPDAFRAVTEIDARVAAGVPARGHLVLHAGTAAVPVRLRRLGDDVVRLSLHAALPLRAGDRAVLRDPAARTVLGGVTVLDADPPPLRRRGAAATRAADLAEADGLPDLAGEVARRGAVRTAHLQALGVEVRETPEVRAVGDLLVAEVTWQAWCRAVVDLVRAHESTAPADLGLPVEAVRRGAGLPGRAALDAVVTATGLVAEHGRVRTQERPALGPAESGVRALEEQLSTAPFDAPDRPALEALGLDRRQVAVAAAAGRLLRLPGDGGSDVVLLPDAPERALRSLAALPQPFTTADARTALGTTRRVAVPLLEHLDARGWTRRLDRGTRQVVPR